LLIARAGGGRRRALQKSLSVQGHSIFGIIFMSSLHSTTSLGALVLALVSTSAFADTNVGSDSTTALTTSTAGDVKVTTDGSITVTSGNAITVDSNSTVTMNGALTTGTGNNATGIYINSGTTSTVNVGEDATISVLENYTVDDDDNIVDGNTASASNRYGIYAAGAASGTILNEGTITLDGENSGGIVLAGNWTGDVTTNGTISVIGDNSVGVSTQGVDGDLTIEGVVKVVGVNSSAVTVNGDVTGALTIQGTVTHGYTYTDDDSGTEVLSRAALRTSTPAVSVTGNVDGGIYIAIPPTTDSTNSSTDQDGDGVKDSEEGTGSIINYGNGAALLIGGTTDTTIGASSANIGTYSLAVEGSISSNSYYSNTDAYGVIIGGQGGNVTLTDGIGVSGSIVATSYDSSATTLLINAGSTVTSLYNSGTISATLTSTGEGSTTAIKDLSGTLVSIENTGYITAAGSTTDTTTALDLSANTTGVTITQYLNDDDADTSADYLTDNDVTTDPTVYAKITGDILLGSGNDTISASTGEIVGDTSFGAGNDTLTLSGNALYDGDISWGTGTATATLSGTSEYEGTMDFAGEAGTITINDTAKYSGQFSNADNVAVTVNGGTLIPNAATTVSFGTLTVGSSGTIGVYVEGDESSTISVNTATLADGASVSATFDSLATAEGKYTVLTANSLTIDGSLTSSVDTPFIYTGAVTTDDNNVYLTVSRKTTDELGLTKSQAAAWDAIYSTAQNDDEITDSLLDVSDSATLKSQVSTMLPDHAGGIFNAVTTGDRLAARHISDDSTMFTISDVGGWFEPIYWRANKDTTDSASYKSNGWGLSAGFERHTSLGNFGVSYAWLSSSVKDNGGSQKLDISQHDFGAFWRTQKGPLMAWARIGASRISIDSTRTYTGTIDDTDFSYAADGSWKGWLFSGLLGASYKFDMSRRFNLKPKVELEEMWLKEDGYAETSDDSDAIALTVASRTSKQLSATPSLTASYSFGTISPDWRPLTIQLEGGRREVLSGGLGDTTAYFNGGSTYDAGSAFTIDGDSLKGAWIGEASLLAGGYDFTWKLTARTEQTSTGANYSARASLSVAF
jgi:uncharacterized protein YdeI (BOF family)